LHTLSITAIKAPTTTTSLLLPLAGLNVPHTCHMHILYYRQRQYVTVIGLFCMYCLPYKAPIRRQTSCQTKCVIMNLTALLHPVSPVSTPKNPELRPPQEEQI
jgi:hypothetical protein